MTLSTQTDFELPVHRDLERLLVLGTENEPQPRLLVAISGGPDSTALLMACVSFAKLHSLEVGAVHVNHNLRGAESGADEAFCAELCAKFGVEYYSHTLEFGAKDEASLREARYAVIASVAIDHSYGFVATGHTIDDQAETLLFRLFRGTSPSGLTGIPASRNLTDGVRLIRPMLGVRRVGVIVFLDYNKQNYRIDSSNLGNDYNRNFIRNEVLPLISKRFGDVVPRIEQLRKMVEEEEVVFSELTETRSAAMFATSSCPLHAFLSLPRALQRRVLADELRTRGVEVSAERIAAILELTGPGGAISLNDEWRVVVKDEHIHFDAIAENEDDAREWADVERTLEPGLNIIPELGCAVRLIPQSQTPGEFPRATSDQAFINLSSGELNLIARRRRAGDVIKPFGMSENVRLKRYLQTHRRADGTHAGHPVVIATDDEIIWVPGVGLSNSVRVDDCATHRLEFMLLSADELPLA
jgi:tRNA(Ile)-lysidine synthase